MEAEEVPKPPKRQFIWKLLKFVRRTVSITVKGHMALDKAVAIAGAPQFRSFNPKILIGLLQSKNFGRLTNGPVKFEAKFERKRGTIVLDSSKQPPLVYFTTANSIGLDESDLAVENRKKGSVLFQIPVTDIRELKKTEGLGWKGKLVVELSAASKEAADGLIILGTEPHQSYHVTGMRARNQLFNRLVAIDAQFWESW